MTISATQYNQADRILSMDTYQQKLKELMTKHGIKNAQACVDSWYLIKADGGTLSADEVEAFTSEMVKLTNESNLFSFEMEQPKGAWEYVREKDESQTMKKFYYCKNEQPLPGVTLNPPRAWLFEANDERDFIHDILPEIGDLSAMMRLEVLIGRNIDFPERIQKLIKLRKQVRRLRDYCLIPGRLDNGNKTFFTWDGEVVSKEGADAYKESLDEAEFTVEDIRDVIIYLRSRYREVRTRLKISPTQLDRREDGSSLDVSELVEITKARIELNSAEDMLAIVPLLEAQREEGREHVLDLVDAFCKRHGMSNTIRSMALKTAAIDEATTRVTADQSFLNGDSKGHLDGEPLPE